MCTECFLFFYKWYILVNTKSFTNKKHIKHLKSKLPNHLVQNWFSKKKSTTFQIELFLTWIKSVEWTAMYKIIFLLSKKKTKIGLYHIVKYLFYSVGQPSDQVASLSLSNLREESPSWSWSWNYFISLFFLCKPCQSLLFFLCYVLCLQFRYPVE